MHAVYPHRLSLAVVVLGIAAVASCLGAPGDVSRSYPTPCKYPAGLACDGEKLFLLDWREGRVHEIAPDGGQVLRSWEAPTLRPHGIAWGAGKLYISDSHSNTIFCVNPADGTVETAFEAPGSRPTGLAWADGALFVLCQRSRKIYKVMPNDGTILQYFDVPHPSSGCLTSDGRYLWVSNRVQDELYLLRPEDGMVLGILDAPGPYAAGVAWLDGCLWNADFQDRRLYELVVNDEQKYRLSDTREARVEYLWTLYNYGPGEVRDLRVCLAVPGALPSQELLSEVEYSPPPTRFAADRWQQRCAIFELGTLPAGTTRTVDYSVKVRVSAIRYLIFPEQTGTLDDIPAEIREKYTVDGSRYRLNSPYIRETVRRVVGDEQNAYWIARKIYNFIIDRLEYEMVGGWDVPEVVLKRGSGSCSEYTFAFIALCRAAGLPARYQGSIVVRGDDASIDEAFHRWAEVYLPNYGWVPVDANRGDARLPADQARGFGELSNRFLITTRGGGDSEYLGWSYNSFAGYRASGYCKVVEENFGFWEPLGAPQKH